MASPLTTAQRKKILALHGEGKGRNDIARAAGVSAASVTKVVTEAGLSFDRTATKAATEARKVDSRARRAEIAALLLEDAARLREQLWQPHEYRAHGGKDFTERRWKQSEPEPVDKLKLVQAASAALGRHMDLERHDADQKAEAAKSMLTDLAARLGVRRPDAA